MSTCYHEERQIMKMVYPGLSTKYWNDERRDWLMQHLRSVQLTAAEVLEVQTTHESDGTVWLKIEIGDGPMITMRAHSPMPDPEIRSEEQRFGIGNE